MTREMERRPTGELGAARLEEAADSVPRTSDKRELPPSVLGLDGKRYPRRRRDVASFVAAAHYMRHEQGLSVRGIVAGFSDLGYRVSVGSVHAWLTGWRCPDCPPVQVRHLPHLNTDAGASR